MTFEKLKKMKEMLKIFGIEHKYEGVFKAIF